VPGRAETVEDDGRRRLDGVAAPGAFEGSSHKLGGVAWQQFVDRPTVELVDLGSEQRAERGARPSDPCVGVDDRNGHPRCVERAPDAVCSGGSTRRAGFAHGAVAIGHARASAGCAPKLSLRWQNARMPMREGCKHFESRTYAGGETVRKCGLDLAPEAPWRCPGECRSYEPRLADVNWQHGTLISAPTPPEPTGLGDDPSIGALLDAAEDIVNAVAARTRAEVDAQRRRTQGRPDGWRRWFRRRS